MKRSSWSKIQKEEGTFFNNHWVDRWESGELPLIIPPDEVLFQQDLGRSLAYMSERLGDLSSKRVLELGCGPGDFSVFMARHGASVHAVDVAPAAIKITNLRAENNSVDDCIHTYIMPAEKLDFGDDTFDWVTGFGLLHHANLKKLGPEIVRVLKPGRGAIFREPLGASVITRLARRLLPYHNKYHSVNEHPLTYEDLSLLGSFFAEANIREFYLLSGLSRFMGSEDFLLFPFLWRFDECVLSVFPPFRSLCRYVVVEYIAHSGDHSCVR
jgi:SAM-dependent methyltransferase